MIHEAQDFLGQSRLKKSSGVPANVGTNPAGAKSEGVGKETGSRIIVITSRRRRIEGSGCCLQNLRGVLELFWV